MATRAMQRRSRHGPRWLRPAWLAACALLVGAAAVPLSAQEGRRADGGIALISIAGAIDKVMYDSVDRRIDEALDNGARTLIFRMDTPGGGVLEALDICSRIKNLPSDVRTAAWVNHRALSAGAMISVACQEIWMSPASSIGDAAPIAIGPAGPAELGETERAKIESPILQEFRDSAVRNGYDPLLMRAMVVLAEEVWWVESVDDPTVRKFLDAAEKKRLIDEVETDERDWQLVRSYRLPWWSEDHDPLPVRQPIDGATELLTLSQYDAVGFGLARGIAASEQELASKLGLSGPVLAMDRSGWEVFATWLNSPLIRGALLVIAMIGLYMEFQSPGLIVPGLVALVAGAIFLAAPYAAGLGNIWALLLVVLGLILLAVEIFVIPGFGIAGILGGLCLLVGLIGTFVPAERPEIPTFSPLMWEAVKRGFATGAQVVIGSLAVAIAGILMLLKVLPETRLADGIIIANPDLPLPDAGDPLALVAQIGDVGVVVGSLRPGGQARFGQEIVDVTSQGEYVEAGQRVQVVRRSGRRIEVRPLPEEATA